MSDKMSNKSVVITVIVIFGVATLVGGIVTNFSLPPVSFVANASDQNRKRKTLIGQRTQPTNTPNSILIEEPHEVLTANRLL